jgi:hypothetical protein
LNFFIFSTTKSKLSVPHFCEIVFAEEFHLISQSTLLPMHAALKKYGHSYYVPNFFSSVLIAIQSFIKIKLLPAVSSLSLTHSSKISPLGVFGCSRTELETASKYYYIIAGVVCTRHTCIDVCSIHICLFMSKRVWLAFFLKKKFLR